MVPVPDLAKVVPVPDLTEVVPMPDLVGMVPVQCQIWSGWCQCLPDLVGMVPMPDLVGMVPVPDLAGMVLQCCQSSASSLEWNLICEPQNSLLQRQIQSPLFDAKPARTHFQAWGWKRMFWIHAGLQISETRLS